MLIERFFDWSHARDWGWFWPYQSYIQKRIGGSPLACIAVAIIPILAAVWILDYFLAEWLYGFLALIFNTFLLIYCFGPQNLWADTFSSITTLNEGDAQFSAEKLNLAFNAASEFDPQAQHHLLLNAIFIAAERRVFAVIFWFSLLGPVGAILYRIVALPLEPSLKRRTDGKLEAIEKQMEMIEAILNWLPARLFTFLFALGGHFIQVFSRWRRLVWQGIYGNDELVKECGWAALGKTHQDILPLDGTVERSAIHLLDRVFVMALIIMGTVAWFV